MSVAEERPQPPRSGSQTKPRGILKNAPHPGPNGVGHDFKLSSNLQWDEENIAATEIQKDSLMKITEPKTPYVRYNAETDTIEGDIPTLDLGLGYRAPSPLEEDQPVSPTMTLSSTGADASAPSSRRTSFSSSGRPGTSMSGSSSRSTSFNLPHESRRGSRSRSPGGEVDFEEDEMDEEARKKHAEFLQARGRHYSNEAEAMKRAKELMAEDDDENPEIPPVPSLPSVTPEDDEEGESMESEYIGEVKAAGHIEDIGEVNGIKPNTTTSGV